MAERMIVVGPVDQAIAGRIAAAGLEVVSPAELEAMQQQVEATKPIAPEAYPVTMPPAFALDRPRRRSANLALAALAAVAVPNAHRIGDRYAKPLESHRIASRGSEATQIARLKAAQAKRLRRAGLRKKGGAQ